MKIRLTIYVIVTFICMAIFAFSPRFNWSGIHGISALQQLQQQGNFGWFITQVGGMSAVIFFGLLILFGLKKKPKK